MAEAERAGRNRRVLVRCSCEAATEKIVHLGHLRNGHTSSCGCVHKAATKAAKTTHGLRKHPLYETWRAMLNRCQNPNHTHYSDYGGRGITVCESWQKFENFYTDMEPTYREGLTIDRKDNNQGYGPDNCRWATRTEQSRNRRNNLNITLNGKTQCLAAWCEELKLNHNTIRYRIFRGQTPEQALQA